MTNDDVQIDLSGKVAVVTGAAAGLGRAEAIGLAQAGATVVVNDMAGALDASDVLDEIAAAGSKGVAVVGDISQRATADELVATADSLGGLNIVVNNAGITRDRILFNMTDEEWDAVIAVHLRGHFLLTRNAATYWRAKAKEGDGTVYGRIVNTSSEAGLSGPVGQPNYGAAKAGITALTLSAARALERFGVRANAIAPRARTAMTAGVFGDAPELAEGAVDPLSTDHVVTLVRFLSSPASEAVNGQLFIVYGPTVTLVAAPTAEKRFTADADAWTPADLSSAMRDYFADRDPERGFSATALMTERD
ncbi:3-ketoacyl-(acyl-carrier-protein) reductase [Mycolicibacterium mageritense DSM 44476 = CIP 104973]|uniref:3-oxoacyl-ACP reductase n=1 Tax=Mycolicibacterium mageritense TaxID=53462 RepID=A0AAI8TRS9_MYCME|nr:3-oxoacyl-ACP reductase [Mycolicibacterium mageritense]MCC9181882.1 3-oxoacyl-ACP reductase [Mycolicibacterium mageritense]CDO21242.1 3-ketoacyl-ACP reductase [Mycolicibacterium mageritense DSM 44476 = CIP 104973]BBX34236.1 3-oxoacyl-ACP reductase [Mycolicibacterium mageritense]BDY27246.1 Putative short-chain type dehydrogenase/reductase [Mycolicibacterium mageritense]GJJ17986.1 3-oxoacyl-ACP reductase [Mycolicibacterium mageritense]